MSQAGLKRAEDETWQSIMPADYRATYQTLISYSGSPWNKHPWDLELTD